MSRRRMQQVPSGVLISITSLKTVIFNHEFHIQPPVGFTLNAANSCHVENV
jgi:hypothetical protein